MEISINGKKKIIAFYLPQFHTIPENDEWWGKGFTEWTNTRKARPLFEGHYQPKIPLNENYYDLSDVTVMEKQAELAKKYGISGFCYYHYWFRDGKKLLEKPVENMLRDKNVNMPFCLCWANENWSRRWDGGNQEVLMEQDYGGREEWKKHFDYLLDFFKDERYITLDGAPLLVIYKPDQIAVFSEMSNYLKQLAAEAGFRDLVIVSQYPTVYFDASFDSNNLDYIMKFEPVMSQYILVAHNMKIKTRIKNLFKKMNLTRLVSAIKKQRSKLRKLEICDYDEAWKTILEKGPYGDKFINGAFTDWDNTARNLNGKLYKGGSPEKFEKYMTMLLKKESALDIVFINAWNEWAEGAYLEPDEKYGYAYLEALKRALDNASDSQ